MRGLYLAIVVSLLGGIVWSTPVFAMLRDIEYSGGNVLRAGMRDIALRDVTPVTATALDVGAQANGAVRVRNDGTGTAPYAVAVDVVGGAAACAVLTATLSRNGATVYSGTLAGAQANATLAVANSDRWDIVIATTQNITADACSFSVTFTTGQQGQGFFDEEVVSGNSVAIKDVPLVAPTQIAWLAEDGTALPCTESGVWTRSNSVTPQWQSVARATAYDVEVTQPDGTVTVARTTQTAGAAIATTAEGVWRIRVRAVRATETSPWSAQCVLTSDHTPPLPTAPVQVNLTTPPQTQLAANGVIFNFPTSEDTRASVYFDKNPGNFFDYITYANHGTDDGEPPQYRQTHSIITAFPTPGTYFYITTLTDRAGNMTVSPPGIFNVPSLPSVDVITLNEIVANPVGSDSAPMPGGEWVELYNRGAIALDLAGWRIKDASGKSWVVSTANSDANGDMRDGGETVIPPGGYLVVYRNRASMTLNNTGGEEVRLYDAGGALMDKHSFNLDGMPVGKSVARFPDGVGIWIDPKGTPGGKNALSKRERDALRTDVLAQCFKGTATQVVRAVGTICDPVFVAFIGMIDRPSSVALALPDLLGTSEEESAGDVQKQNIDSIVSETSKADDVKDLASGGPVEDRDSGSDATDVPASPGVAESVGAPGDPGIGGAAPLPEAPRPDDVVRALADNKSKREEEEIGTAIVGNNSAPAPDDVAESDVLADNGGSDDVVDEESDLSSAVLHDVNPKQEAVVVDRTPPDGDVVAQTDSGDAAQAGGAQVVADDVKDGPAVDAMPPQEELVSQVEGDRADTAVSEDHAEDGKRSGRDDQAPVADVAIVAKEEDVVVVPATDEEPAPSDDGDVAVGKDDVPGVDDASDAVGSGTPTEVEKLSGDDRGVTQSSEL